MKFQKIDKKLHCKFNIHVFSFIWAGRMSIIFFIYKNNIFVIRIYIVLITVIVCFKYIWYIMTVRTISHILECTLTFGEDCNSKCNEHCINQTCDRFNGSCLYGCEYGKQCNEGIILWFQMVLSIFLNIKVLLCMNLW